MSAGLIGLGKEGLISDIDTKIDYLMCTFFFAKDNQTVLCRGAITSLPKLIQSYGNDPVYLKKYVEDKLKSFLGRFFTTASVSATAIPDQATSGITLQLELIVSDEESIELTSRSVGYALQVRDSKFKSIVNAATGRAIYSE